MQLRRFYNWDAPEEDWLRRKEICPVCEGKNAVLNEDGTEILECPVGDKNAPESLWSTPNGDEPYEHVEEDGKYYRVRYVPPVEEVEILTANETQHFSPRIVELGRREGWLSLKQDTLKIIGRERTVVYNVDRIPGRYPDPDDPEQKVQINYYDCSLTEEVDNG